VGAGPKASRTWSSFLWTRGTVVMVPSHGVVAAVVSCRNLGRLFSNFKFILHLHYSRAAIQRREFILSWTVILSVYGADTIAIDLSLSALIA
jgi:hypothetical protein